MNHLLKIILKTVLLVSLTIFIISGAKAAAAPLPFLSSSVMTSTKVATLIGPNSQSAACSGINLDSGGNDCATINSGSTIGSILTDIINILSSILGIVAVIMIIIGGFKYITSGGEASKTASAKNTLLFAFVGLILAVLAQVLVHFVLNHVEKVS